MYSCKKETQVGPGPLSIKVDNSNEKPKIDTTMFVYINPNCRSHSFEESCNGFIQFINDTLINFLPSGDIVSTIGVKRSNSTIIFNQLNYKFSIISKDTLMNLENKTFWIRLRATTDAR